MSDNDSPCSWAVSFSLAYMVALNLTAAVTSLGPDSLSDLLLLIVFVCLLVARIRFVLHYFNVCQHLIYKIWYIL